MYKFYCYLIYRYHYRCVIYGWDEKCMMSEDWIAQMNVDRHPPGRHQPFYNVLAHDGSNRYAAQGEPVFLYSRPAISYVYINVLPKGICLNCF